MDRNVWVELNRDHFLHNIELARKRINSNVKIMAIVKGNAYGHGIDAMIPLLNESSIDRVGVYRTEEAIELVEKGIEKPVHQLTFSSATEMEAMINRGIIFTLSSKRQVDDLLRVTKNYKGLIVINLRVDVSQGGIGLTCEELISNIERLVEKENIIIDSIFTHLPSIYLEDTDLINKEIFLFEEVRSQVNQMMKRKPIYHVGSSPVLYNYKNVHYDLVRIGTWMYGLPSFSQITCSELKQVMTIKTKIVDIKEMKNGFKSSGYTTKSELLGYRRIATVPVGYHDVDFLFNYKDGEVIVEGQKASIIGKAYMSHMFIDVTSIPKANIDSEVVIAGTQMGESITFAEIAEKVGVGITNCEKVCFLNSEIQKVIVSKNHAIYEGICR